MSWIDRIKLEASSKSITKTMQFLEALGVEPPSGRPSRSSLEKQIKKAIRMARKGKL